MSLQWKVAMPLRSAWTLILPSGGPAQHAATRHGDDQHRAVGHPAEARRRIVHFEFHADVSFRRHRFDGVGEKVAEPEAAVPPPRTLAEIDPFAQHARVLAHGFLPYSSRPNSVSSRS